MSKKFLVIDGHHLIFRGYFAMKNMARKDWFPTWAIFWVASMLFNMIEKENPDYLAFTFDYFKSFRHDIAKDYKAQRKPTPDDLKQQMKIVYEMVEKMWIPIFATDWFEADDVFWTISEINSKEENLKTYVVTWDMDAMQLVLDKKTIVAFPNKWYKEPIYFDEKAVFEKYNLTPEQIVCFKSISWDPSDNIKWIQWIWEIWAKKLLKEFWNLDWIYKNLDKIKWAIKTKLEKWEENVEHLVKMTTICRNVPIKNYSIENCKFNWISFDVENLFKEYEFFSLIRRLQKMHSDKQIENSEQISLF